jgi:hypothetical protein
LTPYESGSGFVTDGEEESAHGEVFLFACEDVFDAEVSEEVAVAFAFGCDCVPEDCLLGRVCVLLGGKM